MSDPISRTNYESPMRAAIAAARLAGESSEVPVGAVLLDSSGEIVATDHNKREQLSDPTAHAELLVMSNRARALGDWRLSGHTLVVTLEPCPMCAGAAVNARVERIVYGTADPKAGAAWSLYNIPQDQRLNHRVDLIDGVLASECAAVLSEFFANKR